MLRHWGRHETCSIAVTVLLALHNVEGACYNSRASSADQCTHPSIVACLSRSLQVDSDDDEEDEVLARHSLQPTLAGLLASISDGVDRTEAGHIHAHVTADATAEELSKAEDGLLPLLQKLSVPDASKLLSIITNPNFRPSDVLWTSMRAVNAYLDELDETMRPSHLAVLALVRSTQSCMRSLGCRDGRDIAD